MNDKKPLMDYRRVQKLQTPLLLTGALLSGVGTSVSVPLVILGIAIMLFAIVIGVLYYRCPHCGRFRAMQEIDRKFLGLVKTERVKRDNKIYYIHHNRIQITRYCKHCGYKDYQTKIVKEDVA